jgi:potassium efflux system protein
LNERRRDVETEFGRVRHGDVYPPDVRLGTRLWLVGLCLFFLVLSSSVVGQTEDATEERSDPGEVRSLRAQAETNPTLSEETRARLLQLYDEALVAIDAAAARKVEIGNLDRERVGAGRRIDDLRAEVERPAALPRLDLSPDATVQQAEGALARERARLAANRTARRGLEDLAGERNALRNETSRRLGALDQRIELLDDELRAASQTEAHPELKRAARISLLARREAALQEIETLRAEQALLDLRVVLLPLQIDQAQRRVSYGEQLVALLEAATEDLREADAEESLRLVRELCSEAAGEASALAGVAADTEELAEMFWGPDGVVTRSEQAARALSKRRKNQAELDRIVQLTRRKFEAFGHRGSISRWWPEVPEDFPVPAEISNALRGLERRIPEVQHDLIRLEQMRSEASSVSNRTLIGLSTNDGQEAGPQLQRKAVELFAVQRQLLDEVIQHYGRYSDQLVELKALSRNFLGEVEQVQSFLYERLLWTRSVPRPIVPRLADIADAFRWIGSKQNWREATGSVTGAFQALPGRGLGLVLLFALLFGLRGPLRHRIKRLAGRVESPADDSFGATLESLVHAILLAAPAPLALYLFSKVLMRDDPSTFAFSAATALYYAAIIALLLAVTRQLLAPNGLAEAHFAWPRRITRPVYRGLPWPSTVFHLMIFVSVCFATAGMRLNSPDELQIYNNSLGRVAFVAGMAILGLSLLGMFRPRGEERLAIRGSVSEWMHQVFVYAYPTIAFATLVPAALAAFGFYITGYLLAYQMLRTLWLVLFLLIVSGLLLRWRTTSRRSAPRVLEDHPDGAVGGTDLPAAEAQARQLFRFGILLISVVGLYSIWSEAIPTLQIMKRIQIWPRIVMLETAGPDPLTFSSQAASVEASTVVTKAAPGAAPGVPDVQLPAPAEAEEKVATSDIEPLTLWILLEAILAGVITLVLVRNIPGFLELTLRRRTLLDRGARVAVITLIRYTIIILGVSVTFGLLGVSWSKIQWLAAALTFGLGFGLQEIVANFVSGLILLTERPVRVGDAVTIGNLQGLVTRIQIRATTITLWDRSEMIVPNKEFITSKLVNWTLSDSKRRIDIPFRVAYGSELQKVKDTMLEVAGQHSEVLNDPPPQALLLEFGDDAIRFELRIFVDFGQGLKTRDELHMQMARAFRERGIEFALPHLNIEVPGRGDLRLRAIQRAGTKPESPSETPLEEGEHKPDSPAD